MNTSNTVYTGRRVADAQGRFHGVVVLADGVPLTLPPSVPRLSVGFEWGYGGAGAAQLALALILHATGDRGAAYQCYTWFKWAKPACWGETWRITAAEIRAWVEQCHREQPEESPTCVAVKRCRICGCTEDDCRQCIAATGSPCSWDDDDPDICTRCADEEDTAILREMEGGAA